jgi:hypothetical protein
LLVFVISDAKLSSQIYFLVDEYDAFSNHYLEPYKAVTWEGTEIEETFRAFWAVTISLLRSGTKRVFVTGISPLSMSGVLSGFNVTTNLSLDRDLAGLCGLTISDIQTALKILCGSQTEAYQQHLSIMTNHFNGYHFCNYEKVETVFNTDTCLSYLQVRIFYLLREYLWVPTLIPISDWNGYTYRIWP